ncbi:MAG TPA: hypothetical protein GX725_00035 [Mollicutes bacterium]|jgi:hypothetical protein|nr:hypothetical protein [Mollicutes bacterium]
MEDIIKGSNKESYIVKPFTLDCKEAKILDDGFSASIDNEGNLYLNVFVPLVSHEYLKRRYKVEKMIRDTQLQKAKSYINKDMKKQYSLQVGKKLVMCLKIKKDIHNKISYYVLCEEIEIDNNYTFKNFSSNDFCDVLKNILYVNEDVNTHKFVDDLMCVYSNVLSKYLYINNQEYLYKGNLTNRHEKQFLKGCFTAPLRNRDSFINQYIFLKHMINKLKVEYNKELLLSTGGSTVFDNNGVCKIKKTG